MEGTGGTSGSQEEKETQEKGRDFLARLWRESIKQLCKVMEELELSLQDKQGGWQWLADTSH